MCAYKEVYIIYFIENKFIKIVYLWNFKNYLTKHSKRLSKNEKRQKLFVTLNDVQQKYISINNREIICIKLFSSKLYKHLKEWSSLNLVLENLVDSDPVIIPYRVINCQLITL